LELLGVTSEDPAAAVQWTTEEGAFDGPSDVINAYASAGGTYTLTVTNTENGCTTTDAVVIAEDTEAPEVTLGYVDGALDCNVEAVSMVGMDVFPQEYTAMYTWMNASTGEVASTEEEPAFVEAGLYTLQVEFLENGCTTTVKQAAEVDSNAEVLDLSELVLPNVITPDNNGNNDRFIPFVPGHEDTNVLTMLDEYHIQVYNRWGALLFENNGQPLQWDGRSNGSLVDPGSYVVSVSYYATCGGEQAGELRTTLEVIR
jgi:gliding motility-associated-like protein